MADGSLARGDGGDGLFRVPVRLSVAACFQCLQGFPGVFSAFLQSLTGSCHSCPFCRLIRTFIPMMMNGNSNFLLSVTYEGSLEIHLSSCWQLMVRQERTNKYQGSVFC